jgi:threonine aldolase
MAQLSALRIWTEEKRLPRFAMHTSSHLEQHEERAYQAVFGLQSAFLGEPHRIVLAKDIEALREPVACALVELPMREIGGQLPTWEQLEEIKQATRQRGIRLHMDGARLWESRAYYGRGYDAISEGFDSVYVSLYKGLGAISGAVLAGDRDFVATAKLWRRRLGGTLVCQTAVLVSALMQLELRLSMMDRLYQRALALAEGLNTIPGIRTLPLVPQSNMMHIYFDAAPESVLDSRDDIAARAGLWLLSYVDPTVTGTGSSTELYVGDRLLDLTNDEVLPSIAELVAPR